MDFFFRRIILGARLGSGLVVVVEEAFVPSLGVCGDASTVMVSFMLVGWRQRLMLKGEHHPLLR